MREIARLVILVAVLAVAVGATASEETVLKTESSDGTTIVYEVHGEGSPALVFVHCWACNREFWKEQIESFGEDHRLVAMDLAGHGDSGVDRAEWTIPSLVEDVLAVMAAEELDDVILVGHSMGGPVSLGVASRQPEVVRGVILVDTVQNAEQQIDPEMAERMVAGFRNDYEGMMRQMAVALFPETTPEEVRKFVMDGAIGANQEAMIAIMASFVDVDQSAWLGAAGVPVRAINAAPRPPFQQDTAVDINQKYADYQATLIDGVGHYIQLEKPEAFNTAMRRWVEDLEKD